MPLVSRHSVLSRLTRIFPVNIWMALSLVFVALLLAHPVFSRIMRDEHLVWFSQDSWRQTIQMIGLLELPRLILGCGLLVMSVGLLLRARVAWMFSLILLMPVIIIAIRSHYGHNLFAVFALTVMVLLFLNWRSFNQSSLAASTMFTIVSVLTLMNYAVLGALYLGSEFDPKIQDLVSAIYFSVVTMTTVGYGDIVPVTPQARMFVISIVILGISVFATSISAVLGPVIGGNIKRFIQKRYAMAIRKNHYIICGETQLAVQVYEGMKKRGNAVTVVVKDIQKHPFPKDADLVQGDATDYEVLAEAGMMQAQCVLAMHDDDSQNAFIVLSVKECGQPDIKTVAVMNAAIHMAKMQKVNPDILFPLQVLGGELLSRTLSGEPLDASLLNDLLIKP